MKVMVNSIPKGGTHLLLKLVYLLGIHDDPNRFWLGAGQINRGFISFNKLVKGGYRKEIVTIGCETPVQVGVNWLNKKLSQIPDGNSFGAHCNYSEALSQVLKSNDIKPVCIIRDPRAIAASHMHYIMTWEKHFFHKSYMELNSDKERLKFSITGGKLGKFDVAPLSERYLNFYNWNLDSSAICVRFEDLVGPNGGGEQLKQYEAIQKVSKHLNVELSESDIQAIASNVYGSSNTHTTSNTYRKGKIDSWREELDRELIKILDEEVVEILNKFGY